MNGDLSKVSRIVPASVALLSAGTKDKRDVMTGSAMFVSEDLPLLVVSVAKHIYSHELIEDTGEFVLNVASGDQIKMAAQIGSTHGKEVDKFREFNISTEEASKVQAPLIKGSFANLECKVVSSYATGNYTIYVAEVVDYKVDDTLSPVAWFRNKYLALGKEI